MFDPRNVKNLCSLRQASLVEQDSDKLELLFDRYKLSIEDQLWVIVAKIHAYLDLLLITEVLSRNL